MRLPNYNLRSRIGWSLLVLSFHCGTELSTGQTYTADAVSREVSVFNFGNAGSTHEAISPEVSVFNRGVYSFDVISRETSVFNYGLNRIDLTVGSTAVRAGNSSTVPLILWSLAPITNLMFAFDSPPALLTNWSVQPAPPFIANLTASNSRLYVTVTPPVGQSFVSTQQLAQLAFLAISNQPSAFLPLPLIAASGPRIDGTDSPYQALHNGEVAVIRTNPLLRALIGTNGRRSITLYGLADTNYTIEVSTNLTQPIFWTPVVVVTEPTNMIFSTGDLGNSNSAIFFRARQ